MTFAVRQNHLPEKVGAHASVHSRLQWLGVAGLLAAGLLAVLAASLVLDCSERLRSARAWVEHTNVVLSTIADLRASLLTGGVARRSYVITGDAYYLDEYAKQRAAAAAEFDRLSSLVADNPAQEERISILRRDIGAIWAEFDKQRISSGPAAIAAAMRGARGLSLYKQISAPTAARFEAIRSTETRLLAARESATDVAQFRLLAAAAASIFMALAATALSVYILQRQRVAAQSRELALEIQHMQRLGIMNQTSTVLAHEILHPLTAARNYAGILGSLIEKSGGRDGAVSPLSILKKLEGQITRASDIVKRLRAFVGRSDGTRSGERVEALIGDAAELFEIIDRSADLEICMAPALPDVFVEPVQIRQVFVNLMRNAADAMRSCPIRKLTISAAAVSPALVEIRLEDTGKGLSPDMRRRMFEPFVGETRDGMGLGLSICRSIVLAHGGTIRAESARAGGTAICFTLPALSSAPLARVQTFATSSPDYSVADELATAMRTSS